MFSDSNFARLRCVIDEKAIENDTLRRRLTDAQEQAQKTVDKDLAKNIVLKYLSLPGMSQKFSSFFAQIFSLKISMSSPKIFF